MGTAQVKAVRQEKMSVLEEQQGLYDQLGVKWVSAIKIGEDLRGVGREWNTDYIGL